MTLASLRQLARFSVVGLMATGIHVAVAWMAHRAAGLPPTGANGAGFLCAFLASYFGHHHWSFRRRGNHDVHMRRFLAVSLLAFLISHAITLAVTDWLGLDYGVALLAIVAVVPASTYLASRFWAFAPVGAGAPDRQTASTSVWQRHAGLAIAALTGILAWNLLHGRPFNGDTSWYLVATRMWMNGAALYSDVMEINPPMAFLITRAALVLGDWSGLTDGTALLAVLFIAIGVTLVLVDRLARSIPASDGMRSLLVAASAGALLVTSLLDFGQREHIMLILALPWIIACAMRLAGWSVPAPALVLLALYAMPGLFLKPHFLVLPAAFTLMRMAALRSLRPAFSADNLVFGVAGVLYVAAIVTLFPDYLGLVVPIGRLVYGGYGGGLADFLPWLLEDYVALLIALLIAPFVPRSPQGRFGATLLAAVVALTAIYLVQSKGWHYQLLPALGMALIASAWTGGLFLRARHIAPLTIAMLIVYPCLAIPLMRGPHQNPVAYTMAEAIGGDTAGKGVMVYASNVWAAFPMVNITGMRWTSRYPSQWLVPGAITGLANTPESDTDRRAALEDMAAYARQTATQDFVNNRPDIVIVDMREEKTGFGEIAFDWLDFLKADPAFANAWRGYRLDAEIPGYAIWRRSED